MTLLIALIAFISYGLESIFGFGGTILFLSLGGQIIDFKTLIFISIYTNLCTNLLILASDYKSFSWPHLRRIFIWVLPGVMIGTMLLNFLPEFSLLKIFAVLLLIYALQGLFFPQVNLPEFLRSGFKALGGIVQGIYGTGGPFILMGFKDFFANKSQLRATMAVLFALSNLWRITQASLTGAPLIATITPYIWLVAPLAFAVWLGHRVHINMNETTYRKGILVLILLAGLVYLIK